MNFRIPYIGCATDAPLPLTRTGSVFFNHISIIFDIHFSCAFNRFLFLINFPKNTQPAWIEKGSICASLSVEINIDNSHLFSFIWKYSFWKVYPNIHTMINGHNMMTIRIHILRKSLWCFSSSRKTTIQCPILKIIKNKSKIKKLLAARHHK